MSIPYCPTKAESKATPVSSSQKTVLLIMEFEPIITIDLADTFENLGIEVYTSRTFTEAEALLDANPRINVLLTDVDVPWGSRSSELARILREREAPFRVVILAGPNTALNVLSPDTRIHHKPFNQDQLIEDVLGL